MAEHIKYWNAQTLEWTDSAEEYEELRDPFEYSEEVGDYYRFTEVVSKTGYIHERTGLVTTDITKFEAWLARVEGRAND